MAALLVDIYKKESQMIDRKTGSGGGIVRFQRHIVRSVDAERARRIERARMFLG
jgi:hypothetical protein